MAGKPAISGKLGEIAVHPESPELGRYAAAALVFGASASVLVVEIVALRLLAPYPVSRSRRARWLSGLRWLPLPWAWAGGAQPTSCRPAACSARCWRCPGWP